MRQIQPFRALAPIIRETRRIRTLTRRFDGPLFLSLLLFVIASAGCRVGLQAEREQAFSQQFPYEDMNCSLILDAIDGITKARIDRVVTLELVNHSDQTIGFPAGYGVKGYTYDPENGTWVEIENSIRFPDVQRVLGPRGMDIPSVGVVDYKPILETTPDSLEIRIVVVGHVYDETHGFGEAMAAYLDLTLEK